MTVTLRQESAAGATTKGSALTFQELDNNFVHLLRQGTVEVKADSGSSLTLGEADKDSVLQFTGAGSVSTAISSDSAGETVITFTGTGDTQIVAGSGIGVTQPDSAGAFTISLSDIVADTSPQLGGNLDVNGQSIVSTSNGNITIAPNGNGKVVLSGQKLNDAQLENYKETIHSLSYNAVLQPDVANGNVQTVTLTGNTQFSGFANEEPGQSVTLIIKQDGTGSRLLTEDSAGRLKFAGGTGTLSTGANAVDILTIFYDGTDYFGSLSTNFS
jgi:hypothetical protein